MQKAERELRATVKKAGLSLLDMARTGGGHVSLYVAAPNGATTRVTVSASSSDRRATANNESILRRFARENAPANDTLPFHVEPTPVTPAATPAPPPEPAMTTPATTPAPKASITRNVLTQAEFYRLCDWVKNVPLTGIHTQVQLTEKAENDLGMKLTTPNVKSALTTVGRELPPDPAKRPKAHSANERILARAIVALMNSLGQAPEDDLRSLAE